MTEYYNPRTNFKRSSPYEEDRYEPHGTFYHGGEDWAALAGTLSLLLMMVRLLLSIGIKPAMATI